MCGVPVPVPPILAQTRGLDALLALEGRVLDVEEIARAACRRGENLFDRLKVGQVLEEVEHGDERHLMVQIQMARVRDDRVETRGAGVLTFCGSRSTPNPRAAPKRSMQ